MTTGYDLGNEIYQVGQTVGTGLIYAWVTVTGNENYTQVATTYWAENKVDLAAAATDLGIDAAATAISFVPAVISKTDDVAKAIKKAEEVKDTGKAMFNVNTPRADASGFAKKSYIKSSKLLYCFEKIGEKSAGKI